MKKLFLCAAVAAGLIGYAAEFDPIAYIQGELAKGAKNISVPKARYRLDPKGTEYLTLKGLDSVTIDFNGSEFLGVVKTRMIGLYACTNVTLKNLVIDYPYNLPFTQAVITHVDKDRNWDVKVVEGYPAEEVGKDGNGDCWPIQVYDRKTHELKNPMRFREKITVQKTGADTYRITGGIDRRGDVGDICVFSVRDRSRKLEVSALRSSWCVRCRYVNIQEYATPHGPAFEDWYSDGTEYHNCSIDRRPEGTDPVKRGMRRLRSGNHDAFMNRCAKKGPKIINCTAKYHCDDCVNITGMYSVVMKCEGRKLRIVPSMLGMDFAVGDTCQVMTFDGKNLENLTIVKIGREEKSTKEERDRLNERLWPGLANACRTAYDIEVDKALNLGVGDLIISNNRCGNHFEVRGCDFGHARARGIVTKGSHGIIASNRVEACADNAILIRMSYQWIEGGLCRDLDVIGNTCVSNGSVAVLVGGVTGGRKMLAADSHRDLRFIDNEFSGCDTCFSITGCTGLLFKGNRITTRSNTEASKFILKNCEDVKVDRVPFACPDTMRCAELRHVRLLGHPAEKMNNFFFQRMMTPFAQKDVFGEARTAFVARDDDERLVDGKRVGGLWRGEFWGKLMLGTARVADYLQDEKLLKFVKEESHRLMALQEDDGYLGSYADKELVAIRDVHAAKKAYGWSSVWNLWNRKYAIWGLFMAYKVTGDREILKSVELQMNQWIDMMHKLKIPLIETGQPEKIGLPSMSILKPLLILYVETGNRKYLDYAKEFVVDWDRADGRAPNFYRNANRTDDLYTWYPNPQQWGKCYEMMSCLDGILEYYRVTGDRRSLDTVVAIRENLFRSESNPLGGVGYCDQFYHAARRINAVNEICDTIHWIRLNLDLYLITGDVKYVDAMELCYFNAFMASVFRNGQWTAFAVRGHGRHTFEYQCGYAYNQCCVNNIPRTYMDIASAVVTRDRTGGFHVNMYQDATVEFDGVKFGISGNYPVGNKVVVTVESARNVPVSFRVPGWCPKLTVNGRASSGEKVMIAEAKAGKSSFVLEFDMNARIVDRPLAPDPDAEDEKHWICQRYTDGFHRETLSRARFRRDAAAQIMYGPLVLAKSRRVGDTKEQIFNPFTVNGKGYSLKLSPIPAVNTWGAWDVELSKHGAETIRVKAGDFQSAGDDPLPLGADAFSIWF